MKQLKLHRQCTHDKLINFGFRKCGLNYKLFLPLYENKSKTVIAAEFLVSSLDNYIGYDVMDVCNDTLYTAFYDREYTNEDKNDVYKIVHTRLSDIMDEMVKAVQVYAADGSNNIAVKTGETTIVGTISIGETVTVDGDAKTAFAAALDEFAPDYAKVKLKSKQWGANPTATITVDKEGGVKVSYEPEAFATFMDKKSK